MIMTQKGEIIVETSRHITINTTENFAQHAEASQSDKVALIMGAFSIALLFIVSAILSIVHKIFF